MPEVSSAGHPKACPMPWRDSFAPGHTPHLLEKYSGKHGEEPGFYHVAIVCSCGVKVEAPNWDGITDASWRELITRCREAAKLPTAKALPKLESAHAAP